MHAKGQAKAARIDRIHDFKHILGPIGCNMQHGAEHLSLEARDPVLQGNQGRAYEMACFWGFKLFDQTGLTAGRLNMSLDIGEGYIRDDGRDIGFQRPWIAHHQFIHRAFEHFEEWLRDVFLHIEHPQRRAALACRLEGGGHDIAHGLFGQGGGIDDHCIQATCLGDQRGRGVHHLGHCAVDALCGRGGACEADAIDPRI